MSTPVNIPVTQEDANAPSGARMLVVLGGILSAFVLIPTLPAAWVIIGAVLVPIVWVRTGRTRKAMMAAAGCTTKEEWNTFVSTLPKKKTGKQTKAARHTGPRAGTALAAMAHADTNTSSAPPRRSTPVRTSGSSVFVSRQRPELKYPHYMLISGNYANVEVVGEAYREQAVISALGGLEINVEKTIEDVQTFLIPEPENPHGNGKAVMVWMNGHHVGYLANEDAQLFHAPLAQVVAAGYLPVTHGRLWGVSRYNDWNMQTKHHLYARVALNAPEQLLPTNNPPVAPYSLLPWGTAIQVTKEADHLAELTEHLHGPDSFAIATLEPATRTLKNGAERDYITVHLDGDEIGELTPATSEKVLPSVRHLNDLGYVAAAWARVKGSALAIEVTLQVAKAHEVPDSWLESIPVTVPPLYPQQGLRKHEDPELRTTQEREEGWDF